MRGNEGKQRNVQVTRPGEPQKSVRPLPKASAANRSCWRRRKSRWRGYHQQWADSGGALGGAVEAELHNFAAANESEKITFLLFSNFVAPCNLCKSQMLICGPGRDRTWNSESIWTWTWSNHHHIDLVRWLQSPRPFSPFLPTLNFATLLPFSIFYFSSFCRLCESVLF